MLNQERLSDVNAGKVESIPNKNGRAFLHTRSKKN